MTELTKPITRVTDALRHEKSRHRRLIVSVEPSGREDAVVGVRLQGTRQTYRIGVQSLYNLAVAHHVAKIEKEAKRLVKEEKLPLRTARARAKKAKDADLK